MNLFRFELKRETSSILWWVLGLAALQFFMLSFFPIMADQQGMMDLILEYYPKEMLAAFGLTNATSLGTIEGYLIFSFIFAQVALAIHASIVGFTLLSVEETESFADFLLTKPISRSTIFKQKLLSSLVILLTLALATILATVLGIIIFVPDIQWTPEIFWLFASLAPLQWLFLATTILFSQWMRTVRTPVTFAMGWAFGMYMLYALSGALDIEFLRYLNFFNYIDISKMLTGQPFEPVYYALILGILVFSGVASWWLYLRRNIAAK